MTKRDYHQEPINYAYQPSALGLMLMAATDKGICAVFFGDDQANLYQQLELALPKAQFSNIATPMLSTSMQALADYLAFANCTKPQLQLDMRGTDLQLKVWEFLLSLKPGQELSYSQVAAGIQQDKAVRAVASACGKNSIAVLIPCHQILRQDGGLGGYRWGLERKQRLLEMERG